MKKRYSFLVTIIIIGLLVYALKGIDFYEIWNLLKKVDGYYFALAFLCALGSFLLWNLRWMNTLEGIVNVNYWFLLKVLFAGVFLNNITPGTGIGGEPARAYFLSKKYNKPKTKMFGVILAEKMFNLSIFLLFVLISLLSVLILVEIPRSLKIFFESAVLVIFVLIILFLLIPRRKKSNREWLLRKLFILKSINKNFKNFNEFKLYVRRRISNLKGAFSKSVRGKKKLYRGLLFSAGFWMLTFFVSYFLFLSFNVKINFLSVIIAVSLSNFIGDISPLPGGIGMMEGTMFLLYSSMGIPDSLAIIVTLLSRFIYYFFALFVGGISLLYLRFSVK
ncbi:MAG: flippase-like domain-containing protein [archaeon]